MSKILLYALLIYLLYRFITQFVVPVSRATSQMKDKIREMQQVQEQQARQAQQARDAAQAQTQAAQPKPGTGSRAGDYIDFEEVK
ncbi:DUF4834 family protein [Sediminibacterium ginsengisoli]|uniref:DUF4834 family protein n=1 Tax=Sediminibacterium ginsengisoli TaxID=413434 RepID=A0A1T4M6X9_9BACT|nr:DUF4834 family protein [Sediminibacterium ginsengisoli]SJZ62616.1 hypothetical protein SAMN04488132_103205 [Sediminibacterium ginsengisoli]